jgi:MFS family permease
VSLGIIEGAAEATNSLLKILSGWAADRTRHKRRLVLIGYSTSSALRPLIALTTTWTQVFVIRVADRVGKGVRTAPRDAMLAFWTTSKTRGRAYGLQRGMDHLGAVIGPALATLFLIFFPGQYRTLFVWTIVPGAVAVALILLVPDEAAIDLPRTMAESPPAVPAAGRAALPRRFHLFIVVLALFMLGNSTDAFLLLRLTEAAGTAQWVPLMWSGLHVVKATTSIASGGWSDRIGRRTVIATGWLIYALVYGGFAASRTLPALLSWFLVYGLYYGFAEGTEKALVADLAPPSRRGVAFGVYNAVQGFGTLAASVLFGMIWRAYGTAAAFGVGSALALGATALLFIVLSPQENARARV